MSLKWPVQLMSTWHGVCLHAFSGQFIFLTRSQELSLLNETKYRNFSEMCIVAEKRALEPHMSTRCTAFHRAYLQSFTGTAMWRNPTATEAAHLLSWAISSLPSHCCVTSSAGSSRSFPPPTLSGGS